MWALLPRRVQLIIIVGASMMALWALQSVWGLLTGEAQNPLHWVSPIVFVVGVILLGVANTAWFAVARWLPVLQSKTFPDLNGEWTGTLTSTWVDPKTNQPVAPIPISVSIRQTLLAIHITLQTNESRSESTRTFLERLPDAPKFRVWYSYNNDPQAQFHHRSSPHEGVAFLDMDWSLDRHRLTGRYYTARRTTGDMELRRSAQ
jgi:hypothetical protein